jgi:hypothetical protein
MNADLIAPLIQSGPLGIFVIYLIWRELRGAEKRGQIEKERTEADKALAAALAALTVTIQHLEQRINK